MLLKPSHHVITLVKAYVGSYGPAVNDSTSLCTQKCIFRVDGHK
jgi:hypothetical protein